MTSRLFPVSGLASTRSSSATSTMHVAARLGLAARGLVYVLMGMLAFLVARGSQVHVDQKSALSQVLARPYGFWLVAFMAIGFAAYAAWRLSEAAFGVVGQGRSKGPRLQSLVRGAVYASLAVTAVSLLMGSRQAQSKQQQGYASTAMSYPLGRWAVALVGVAVLIVGAVMVWQGANLRFMRYFPGGATSRRVRAVIRVLGRVGTVARGFVFMVTGALVALAGLHYKSAKASGLDGAVNTIQSWPMGNVLLICTAVGLIVFGLYGLLEARYRRV